MDFITLFLVAVGLAMDAFAVSVANGIVIKKVRVREAAIFGLFFGVFQFLMPLLGWMFGRAFSDYIIHYGEYLAFILLSFIGGKMIYETFHEYETLLIETTRKSITARNMVVMAFATSVDAMAIGVSFAVMNINIWFSAAVIGTVAFLFSFAGVYLGKRLGSLFKTRAEQLGGLILILIGLRILSERLFL